MQKLSCLLNYFFLNQMLYPYNLVSHARTWDSIGFAMGVKMLSPRRGMISIRDHHNSFVFS